MSVATAVVEAATWDVQAGSTPKALGLLMGGGARASSDLDFRRGAYNQSSPFAGPVHFGGSFIVEATSDTKALIQNALRSAGVLPALKFKAGTDAVNLLHENAYINTLRVRGSVNSPLEATLDYLAVTETETASGITGVALGSNLLPFGGASVTVGGSAFKCQDFEIQVNNNIEDYFTLDAKGSNVKRLPTGITLGAEEIAFRARFLEKHTWDVDEDAPAFTIAAIVIYTDGVNSVTFTFSNLARRGNRELPIKTASDLVDWDYEFLGGAGSLAIT